MKAFSPPSPLRKTGVDDAQIAALTITVAWSYDLEEPFDRLVGHEIAKGLTARMKIAFLAQGDHLFQPADGQSWPWPMSSRRGLP